MTSMDLASAIVISDERWSHNAMNAKRRSLSFETRRHCLSTCETAPTRIQPWAHNAHALRSVVASKR